MDFSGLVKAVKDFWDFVWPAIVCLTVLLAVVRIVAPVAWSRIRTWIVSLRPDPSSQATAYKSFKRFGFDKIIPILTAFVLLFIMDVGRSLVTITGNALPPEISYRYQLWFLQHVSNNRLACLWAHFEDAPHFYELQNDLERALNEIESTHKDADAVQNIHNWTEHSGAAQASFDACKSFIAWTVLWMLLESIVSRSFPASFWRTVGCIAIFVAAGIFFLFRFVWAIEQEQYARISAAEVYLFQKAPSCSSLSDAQMRAYGSMVAEAQSEAMRENNYRWWNLTFLDTYYLKWIWGQIVVRPDQMSLRAPDEYFKNAEVEKELKERISSLLEAAKLQRPDQNTGNSSSGQSGNFLPPGSMPDVVEAAMAAFPARYENKKILWVAGAGGESYEEQLFKNLGITVNHVSSTSEAVGKLADRGYDLVIVDMLRQSNKHAGYDLLATMKGRGISVPVVIYSASSSSSERSEAIARGATGETNRPAELLQVVSAVLLNQR